jgi:hypothetical protein
MADRPGYTKDANQTVADIKRCLERDLKGIAERLAAHEKAEKVLVSHVSGAFAALANAGLAKKKFDRRVEFEVGAARRYLPLPQPLLDSFRGSSSPRTLERSPFLRS